MLDLNNKMEQLRKTKDAEIDALNLKLEDQRATMQAEINRLKLIIVDLEGENLNLKNKIQQLEDMITKLNDIEAQLREQVAQRNDDLAAREELQKALDNATDYILELEEKVYKANKTSLELLKQLQDAEKEIDTLK